jgi:hypothetical protein
MSPIRHKSLQRHLVEHHAQQPEIPSPEPIPPISNPDPQPGDPEPKVPPPEDEPGRHQVPVELPGKPKTPERV